MMNFWNCLAPYKLITRNAFLTEHCTFVTNHAHKIKCTKSATLIQSSDHLESVQKVARIKTKEDWFQFLEKSMHRQIFKFLFHQKLRQGKFKKALVYVRYFIFRKA